MDLKNIRGIGSIYEKKLREAGIKSVEELILANAESIAMTTNISKSKIEKWKEEARKIVEYKEAEVIEDLSKNSFIEIEEGKAKVKIMEISHEAKIFYDKDLAEKEEIAVLIEKKPKLWFGKKWHENIPYKKRRIFGFIERKKC
ncbi:MAG: helix-hairpin-helix domain-containing protein [Candidatus Thermoplasmatota archaeon]